MQKQLSGLPSLSGRLSGVSFGPCRFLSTDVSQEELEGSGGQRTASPRASVLPAVKWGKWYLPPTFFPGVL